MRSAAEGTDATEVLRWAAGHLEVSGEPVLVKRRPWSRVWWLPTAGGRAWLKACPPALAHEVALVVVLAARGAPHVLAPLAADAARGWLLLPDGGPTLRDAGEEQDRWPAALAGYAELQRAATPQAAELLAAGVPDTRPEVLAEVAADVVGRRAPHLRHLLPLVADEAAELAELGPAPTVQHDDLHDGNVFAAGLRPFDWGDACVGHPFTSLRVGARTGHADGDRTAYLAGWSGDPARLHRAADLATHLGSITRALSWERALTSVPGAPPPEFSGAVVGWLERLAEPTGRP
ncbi:aminoglycoside phosphotransferase family protein [Kineococcus auxinigenes]|uniref:aminoglycoside phosphotransferase family protein n=1 Tax=unclassified Kineococcus TaxID=2621656 RepID=UPI003D7EE3A6